MSWQRVPEPSRDDVHAFVAQFRKRARFLVDENLGVEVANVLRELGWNMKYVAEVGLTGHTDEDVFARAWSDDRIVLTHDTDFLNDRRFPPHSNPGVVVLPGAQGEEEALLQALAAMLSIVAPFREGYRGTKVVVSSDNTWTFIRRNRETGAMERTRLRLPRRGHIEVWGDESTGE